MGSLPKSFLLILTLIATGSCAAHAPVSNDAVNLYLEQSHQRIKAGEIVTFTANAFGTTGRREDIQWHVDGGDLDILEKERYARVQYDTPGSYTVEAQLMVDGDLVDVENAYVTVEPLY